MKKNDRDAFTLIELLVVIAIIGILAAITLPAIQAAREAMRRTACQNKIKQLSLACINFESVHKRFPAGIKVGDVDFPYMSWIAQILPQIERAPLWELTTMAYELDSFPFGSEHHVGFTTVIDLLHCPSDATNDGLLSSLNHGPVAYTNYIGNCGTNYKSHDGVLYQNSKVTYGSISDGSSNTLLMGERPPSKDHQYGWWYIGFGQDASGSPDMLLGAREINILEKNNGNCPIGPYSFQKGHSSNQCDVFHHWSYHPQGSNFGFCDGSVRFITYEADDMLPILATTNNSD